VIDTIGFVTIVVADWRTANRWERERQFMPQDQPSRERDA